eukprot:TRINITY_DN2907_c0_g1_i1.p1 TRINITY_DN2907_c0_g1~~TRINITY_DN2907_c0_g1_i1.p1  ORF type:complete len:251 (-),score=59.06 TRINITY_DN2907_c0_g1_i1:79-831(-)
MFLFFFFNYTVMIKIYTILFVGSVRCVQETVFIILIQDEIPEIREKISNMISQTIICTSTLQEDNALYDQFKGKIKYNFNYVQAKLFRFVANLAHKQFEINKNLDQLKLFYEFFLSYIFEGSLFNIKKLNHYDQRIFAYDKPNQFQDDMIIKELAFQNLIIVHQNNLKEEIKFDFINDQCSEYYFIKENCDELKNNYQMKLFEKDEFIYECIINAHYLKKIENMFAGKHEHIELQQFNKFDPHFLIIFKE